MEGGPAKVKRETLTGTVTRIRRALGIIEMKSDDGRQFSMHRLLLFGSGLNYWKHLRVGDQVRFVVKTIVRYEVEKVTAVIPGAGSSA